MTLEVLSEEDIQNCNNWMGDVKEFKPKWTNYIMQKALNTIKLQRQQLAEQEHKVWNEAMQCLFNAIFPGQCYHASFTRERLQELMEALLKPESEASGE